MINFLTLGYDCSPAAALRDLDMRDFALPFDWVQSSVSSLQNCLQEDFSNFHCHLRLKSSKNRIIDYYGLEFPHDYPTINAEPGIDNFPQGIIVQNWNSFTNSVKEKYNRRIQRFRNIIQDDKPIVILCRYPKSTAKILFNWFKTFYSKPNVWMINATRTNHSFYEDGLYHIYPEQHGTWNDTTVWKDAIEKIKNKILEKI